MCTDCEARRKLARDAWVKGKIGEAAGHVAKGAVEMVGLKPKTGGQELASEWARAEQTRILLPKKMGVVGVDIATEGI